MDFQCVGLRLNGSISHTYEFPSIYKGSVGGFSNKVRDESGCYILSETKTKTKSQRPYDGPGNLKKDRGIY